jgi:hypothetical protein
MPQNITPANPTAVLPKLVSIAFNEQVRFEALVNQGYADASSDRAPLVQNPRSFFRITTKLSPAQWKALRDFFSLHYGEAFYFYFGRETTPPYSVDTSGAATDGRYTVVFDGLYAENYTGPGLTWADSFGSGQSQSTFQLREVE